VRTRSFDACAGRGKPSAAGIVRVAAAARKPATTVGAQRMTAPTESCALVILSCDACRDLWAPCLALHRRYWPDCPYPIVLVSETAGMDDARVRSLRVGTGLAWSDVARAALGALEQEHVLLMLDDFFLTRPVSTDAVEAMRARLAAQGGAYLRLGPWPRPTGRVPGCRDIGEHERGTPFRASLQAAFWRRSALLRVLVPGESPWDFEREGSLRSGVLEAPFLSTRAPVIHYIDVLKRGRWSPQGIALCQREGLPVDLSVRPCLSVARDWPRRVRVRLWLMAMGPVSSRLRRRLRRLVGR
jgi:hypothetical protein